MEFLVQKLKIFPDSLLEIISNLYLTSPHFVLFQDLIFIYFGQNVVFSLTMNDFVTDCEKLTLFLTDLVT